MSRRRGEFEHRTSIFEGAFRAWSHLGGQEPEDLEEKPTAELDPLSNPIEDDARLTSGNRGEDAQPEILNPNGTKRRIFPYEPLPRSGLAHPYVQAILSPWLGPDADNDAIQLGLTTLRTWWQHRRKGESGSAIAALGTEKMKGVIEGYTRHFFALAHCLVMNDKEQPPRTLQTKMKELEKKRNKMGKKKGIETTKVVAAGVTSSIAADLTNSALSPLERLHVAQQRNLGVDPGISAIQVTSVINPANPLISIKNKCVATKVNLPAVVDAVNRQASQLAHSGSLQNTGAVSSSLVSGSGVSSNAQYGDPDTFPIVFVASNGDILLAMSVEGITCAHCVKIVETVLKGCNGNKSPIDGLLDAAADHDLCSVIVKIDRVSSAKRVAFESARNLAMVGYTAKAKVMNAFVDQNGTPTKIPESNIIKAFEAVGESELKAIFDWNIPCSCPDNGVLRSDCSR
jgi:copper chaperone CopZ